MMLEVMTTMVMKMMTMSGTEGLHMEAESLLKNLELIIVSEYHSYTISETHT